jgi:TolA-binding protein
MKKLILIVLFFIAVNSFAQDKNSTTNEFVSDKTKQCIKEIAANSQLRLEVLQMMITQTNDKPEEMQLLIDVLMDNPQMKDMIIKTSSKDNLNKNSINQPSMLNKYKNTMKKIEIKEKPIIKN